METTFKIGDKVRCKDAYIDDCIIVGMNLDKNVFTVEADSNHCHGGTSRKYWYDEKGESVYHTREEKDKYYYVHGRDLEYRIKPEL